jgi:hypothetical protein
MICFSAFPRARCHFCKSGKWKCQYSAKPPKEGKVAVKVEKSAKVEKSRPKEKVKGETKRMGLREVLKPAPKARRKPAVVTGLSQFPGLMSTDVPAVRAKASEKVSYWVGTNLVSKPVPTWYTKGWDFSVIGDMGRLSLGGYSVVGAGPHVPNRAPECGVAGADRHGGGDVQRAAGGR